MCMLHHHSVQYSRLIFRAPSHANAYIILTYFTLLYFVLLYFTLFPYVPFPFPTSLKLKNPSVSVRLKIVCPLCDGPVCHLYLYLYLYLKPPPPLPHNNPPTPQKSFLKVLNKHSQITPPPPRKSLLYTLNPTPSTIQPPTPTSSTLFWHFAIQSNIYL